MFSIVACGVADMEKVFSFQVNTYSRVTCVTGVTPADNERSLVTQSKNEGVTGVTNSQVTPQKVTQVTPGLPEGVTGRASTDADVTPVTLVTPQNIVTQKIQAAVNLAEKLKADRRAADLEEIDKAFNTVMYAERTGNESDFIYALMELEALTEEHSQVKERRVA